MAYIRKESETKRIKDSVLGASAKLFLTKGFTNTSIREISKLSKISSSTLIYVFKTKEEILVELVEYVLESQFSAAKQLVQHLTDDLVFYYAVETTMQLYMAESHEYIRDLYLSAYSLPRSSELIHQSVTKKLGIIFKEYLPNYDEKDFYELELASSGIIRSYMSRPCDMYFTLERKRKRFIETALRIYQVPSKKIEEAVKFLDQFDFEKIADEVVKTMLQKLTAIEFEEETQ